MLTREQKAWLVTGYCNTDKGCSDGCALYDICKNNHDDFIFYKEAELDSCLKIIAPTVLDEPKPAATPQWISVEDKLPEAEVLAANFAPGTYGYKEYIIGYVSEVKCTEPDWHKGKCYATNDHEILDDVTHWMPLPEPPEVVQKHE